MKNVISIHALRVEGDIQHLSAIFQPLPKFLSTPSGWRATAVYSGQHRFQGISIHALRVEGDGQGHKINSIQRRFLSTPSGWRATPQGARLPNCTIHISIHALRVEGDISCFVVIVLSGAFLSTPSGWRATRTAALSACSGCYFYPRPPGGGRQLRVNFEFTILDFYPRPPGGGRHTGTVGKQSPTVFLSTPSGWRATCMTTTKRMRL